MSKIKVLQFPIANSNGGITHYALENWKWMDKERFQCDFVTMSKKLDFADEILATGSKIYYVSCYAEDDMELFVKEFNQILDNGYDVVHLHTKQWKSFLVEELCKQHNIPKVIVHAHNTMIDVQDETLIDVESCRHEAIKKKLNDCIATDFWACSKLAADFIFGGQISKDKVKIMANAVDLNKFKYDEVMRLALKKENDLEGCYVIGQVGRFACQKNHEFTINVFENLSEQIDNIRLLFLGDGELIDLIKQKVNELGLAEKVIFLGSRSDVNKWYSVMDLLVMPSRFEGLPITMIEAQAAGVYCIGSDCITDEVCVTDSVSLLPLEVSKWTDFIMDRFKSNSYERYNNGMKLIEAGYSIENQIKVIEEEYSKIGGVVQR